MIRPLVFAIIEYFLAYRVYKYGKSYREIIFWALFLLATYQFGEALTFWFNGNPNALKVAYIATTLLPPLGVLLLEKLNKKQYGYYIFQALAIGFCTIIAYDMSMIVNNFGLGDFCVRVYSYNATVGRIWLYYYQGTLLYTMFLCINTVFTPRVFIDAKQKLNMKFRAAARNNAIWILGGFVFFNVGSILISRNVEYFRYSAASLMCAMALLFAFIITGISTNTLPNVIERVKILANRFTRSEM